MAQGEAKAILEAFVQQQRPWPLPGEGAPRRAPISRAQWQLWEHRETGLRDHVAHCLLQPSGAEGDWNGSMGLGFQVPSPAPNLLLTLPLPPSLA